MPWPTRGSEDDDNGLSDAPANAKRKRGSNANHLTARDGQQATTTAQPLETLLWVILAFSDRAILYAPGAIQYFNPPT
jgi:hypothetical protein